MSERDARALSFGAATGEYERARPGYPDEIVDAVLAGDPSDVLDLGAGTGKLTRALAVRGLRVSAVDPDPAMLAALAERSPDIPVAEGTAESIPFPDAAFDLVTVAQAWHWVDAPRAFAEVARVLRPGGALALVWNERDERDSWNRRFGEIAERSGAEVFLDEPVEFAPPFDEPVTTWVDWSRELAREQVLDLVRSRSAWLVRDEDGRAEMERGIRELLDSDADSTAAGRWVMPMRTVAFVARRD
ncbi:class I SAM-dependent methyltransferase [Schumannella luteola]|uniref:SAM-dependent methyltransferase n=1 Tax=Schumannella luteola TaxID=472059 RepID=A0A852YDR3_9MICO|nr:class I SAM-dependent methyltransferase [Schumannella luteola]NYG99450.1 SAM-dependent methyltransferase [Schumannella luteola]TPX06164.1 methyltransferase domain-containing protein [Schumannella luteola]